MNELTNENKNAYRPNRHTLQRFARISLVSMMLLTGCLGRPVEITPFHLDESEIELTVEPETTIPAQKKQPEKVSTIFSPEFRESIIYGTLPMRAKIENFENGSDFTAHLCTCWLAEMDSEAMYLVSAAHCFAWSGYDYQLKQIGIPLSPSSSQFNSTSRFFQGKVAFLASN